MPRVQGQFLEKNSGEEMQKSEDKNITLDNLREVLLLGKITEKLRIGGFAFEISTLSAGEQREVISKVMKMQTENKMLDIRPITMAYSLKTINGVKIEDLCDDNNITDVTDRRLNVILNMQINLVDRIFKVYESLIEESNRQVGLEDLKK